MFILDSCCSSPLFQFIPVSSVHAVASVSVFSELCKKMPQHWKYIQSLNPVHSVRSLVEYGYIYQQYVMCWFGPNIEQFASFISSKFRELDFWKMKNLRKVGRLVVVQCLWESLLLVGSIAVGPEPVVVVGHEVLLLVLVRSPGVDFMEPFWPKFTDKL
jgi:hypothetical protein